MKIIVHSAYNEKTIRENFGKAQYSYYFLLAAFLPALRQLGTVVTVADPEREVDAIFDQSRQKGEACVFLCFAPPHDVPVTLRCPTIPIFAWEFTTIPCEAWSEDPRSDWRVVFAHCGRAIALSTHTAELIRQAMGPGFPVYAIPAATFDSFAGQTAALPPLASQTLHLRGFLFDTAADARFSCAPPVPSLPQPAPLPAPPRNTLRRRIALTAEYMRLWYRDAVHDILPRPVSRAVFLCGRGVYGAYRMAVPLPKPPAPQPVPEHNVSLDGVVYVSVLPPNDGRKNWQDMLSGFAWTFRDNPETTLIVKMPSTAAEEYVPEMDRILARFAPLKCRVLLFAGFLEDAEYQAMMRAATYYVNTSFCEGLCLPLMEFLSAGKPAIAPGHTAMADYITPDNAFVLRGSLEHYVWPFDPRVFFTTMRYRLSWPSLAAAFAASFRAATDDGETYAAMSAAAQATMRAYCSTDVVRAALVEALGEPAQSPQPIPAREPALVAA